MDDRVPVRAVVENSEATEAQKPLEEKDRGSELGYLDDLEYHRVSDMLDISYDDRKDQRLAEKVSFLIDWARDITKTTDRTTNLLEIKDLARRLGITHKGVDLVKKLWQWTKLDVRRKFIEKEMEVISVAKP